MEFLEFLGEWETADGEWFDPLDFDPGTDDVSVIVDPEDDAAHTDDD